jgi:hypothetical protein
MLKSTTAVMFAAAIAAAVTVLSAPTAQVDAGPVAKPVEVAMKACTNQPWPYLHCVGTPFGNPKVRLISTERVAR